MPSPLVTHYVDAALAQLRRVDGMRFPGGIPDEMRDSSVSPWEDWVGWHAIPSTVTDADLAALEHETSLAFPPLYRDLLQYRHFVELTEIGLRFERHLCHNWRDTLRSAYFHGWPREDILDIGLLPFGSETLMDAGPVCFDTRGRVADGDCPVVFWDHDRPRSAPDVQLMFSSCRRMFECLTLVASTDFNFIYHDDHDDSSLLPKKRALLSEFLSLDRAGAGGPGLRYWTSWGVVPE
jgi:hypothetical protein